MPIDNPNRRPNVVVNRRLVMEVATGLIAIAELAMPDTYFATDSRVKAARKLLKEIE